VGVPADTAQAAAWFRKAAVQGLPFAQYELGSMYDSGEGVSQDYAEAYFWMSLAVSLETRPAKREEIAERRDVAGSHLTEAALTETRDRIRKWTEEHPSN